MDKTKKVLIRAWQNKVLTHSIEVLKPLESMSRGDRIPESIYNQRADMENLVRLVGRQETKW